jgi:acetyl-CoA acetyltransferase
MIRSIRRVAILGGRITATLAKILREMDGPARGLISICAAGGQGITALLERLWDFRSSRPRT